MKKFLDLSQKAEESKLFQSIRSGLVMAIPFLLIGSMALVLKSFPILQYQNFIANFCGGILKYLFEVIYNSTYGLLSLYITATISINYARIFIPSHKFNYGTLFSALIGYGIFCGVGSDSFSVDSLGPHGMFLAVICGVMGSFLYVKFSERIKSNFHILTDGADAEFTHALNMVFAICLSTLFFAVVEYFILTLLDSANIYALLINNISKLFVNIENSLVAGILFVFISNLLWFFGIHGSDVLDSVHPYLFSANMEVNQALMQNGQAPTEIVTKTFIDIFVGMGGCGAAICLLITILVFHRKKSSHLLARLSLFPMLFNINELLVFGLPIVFNPFLFIPFLVTPLVIMLTSYFAMASGIVPYVTNTVEWTTPLIISGYMATGSVAGAILQLFNVIIGVLLYLPFFKLFEEGKMHNAEIRMNELVNTLKQAEEDGENILLLSLPNLSGSVARNLSNDMKNLLENGSPCMYYQPQCNQDGECIGVEALLRWKHPLYGMIYPPLIIKIASEGHQLEELELAIFKKVAQDTPEILKLLGDNIKISINVSATTINKLSVEKIMKPFEIHNTNPSNICIEVTEQAALQINDKNMMKIQHLKDRGCRFAIDDFSMGSTSLKYLQNNLFDYVKLDGSLVKDMMENERSERIVASLVTLSDELSFSVIAEYVETEIQQQKLYKIGCNIYQGYLYSPAISLNELCEKYKNI
ncbi:MAG: PTS sugar transporter subunit IIC/EAL domain-containing protein [Lachnospiraceae bacterium]